MLNTPRPSGCVARRAGIPKAANPQRRLPTKSGHLREPIRLGCCGLSRARPSLMLSEDWLGQAVRANWRFARLSVKMQFLPAEEYLPPKEQPGASHESIASIVPRSHDSSRVFDGRNARRRRNGLAGSV